MTRDTHVTWHEHNVTRSDREQLAGHSGCVVWFTGLSGCGKSTIANAVDLKLHERGIRCFLLDGDNIRHGLNAGPAMLLDEHGQEFANRFGLGFGAMDREENIRRIGALSQLFCSAGLITLTAFVSPYQKDRDLARRLIVSRGRPDDFVEVFVNTPLSVCEKRDPKGLYKKARAGEIKNFTGVDDPYEAPVKPEIMLQSESASPDKLADQVIAYLESCNKIPKSS